MMNGTAGQAMNYFVDKFNRKYLLLLFGLLQHGICMATYYVTSYEELIVIRTAFGIIQSINTPACLSLIQDYFKGKWMKVQQFYGLAVSLGVGLASLSSLLNAKVGWRYTAVTISFIGVFISLLTLFLREPDRQFSESHKDERKK